MDSNIARTNILQFTSFHGNIIMLFFLVSLFNFVGLITDWQGRVHVVNTQRGIVTDMRSVGLFFYAIASAVVFLCPKKERNEKGERDEERKECRWYAVYR